MGGTPTLLGFLFAFIFWHSRAAIESRFGFRYGGLPRLQLIPLSSSGKIGSSSELPVVFGSRLGAGVDLQFLVNPAGEGADGAEADVQRG